MRILVFRGGAVGDFILTLPVFQALRQAWPRSDVTLVGYPHIGELARISGWVQQVLSIDAARFSAYFQTQSDLPPQEAEFLRSFDLVVSFLHDPDGGLRLNWKKAGARRIISVSPQVAAGHAADHFLGALAPLGLTDPGCGVPRLDLPAAIRASGPGRLASMKLQPPVIAIHPGSGSARKNWPLPSFLALAEKIQQARKGLVLWIVGEADGAIARFLEKECAGAPVLKGCSLPEVASVLSQCRACVGNDSGITHLAAALGIPTLALFGPSDPAAWGPRGANVSIIRGRPPTTAGLARLPVEAVDHALTNVLLCRGQ